MISTVLRYRLCLLACLFLIHISCKEEIVPKAFHARTDHEAYLQNLEKANLHGTALGQSWISASRQCFDNETMVELPYQETFYIAAERPTAMAFAFSGKRGEKIKVDFITEAGDDTQTVFIDLFRKDFSQEEDLLKHIASAEKQRNWLGFEPRRNAEYSLRIQPELLRGGRYRLRIAAVPALEFPVAGGSNRDIGSFFGDPRDGGRRKHHGIDIFAKRHTPIVAPTDGYVRFAGERGRGGRVVWMRDRNRDMTLYFAHLQEIFVEKGMVIEKGDTLGSVGNTGNARTTPPHLHFGIYQNGPIDPYYFVAHKKKKSIDIRGDQNLVGSLVRTKRGTSFSSLNGDFAANLPRHQLVKIVGASSDFYKVRTPKGNYGMLKYQSVEPLEIPMEKPDLPDKLTILDSTQDFAFPLFEQIDSQDLVVLAKDTNHWYVKTHAGQTGWVEMSQDTPN